MIFEDTDCILFKNDGTIKIGDPLKIYKVHDVIYDVYNTKRKQAKRKKNSRDSGSTADGSQIVGNTNNWPKSK